MGRSNLAVPSIYEEFHGLGSWKKTGSLNPFHYCMWGGPRNLSKNSLRGWIFAHKTAHLRVVNYGFSCLANALPLNIPFLKLPIFNDNHFFSFLLLRILKIIQFLTVDSNWLNYHSSKFTMWRKKFAFRKISSLYIWAGKLKFRELKRSCYQNRETFTNFKN